MINESTAIPILHRSDLHQRALDLSVESMAAQAAWNWRNFRQLLSQRYALPAAVFADDFVVTAADGLAGSRRSAASVGGLAALGDIFDFV